ncbi:AMP-binding protein [Azospirillum cavernae]|uniref:AMP-binding protein n=1 Tax=Azospirillum cavernae TaxID=2320860 RepID=UPI00131499C3|nr:AMP-binding protein [Azospirillum cavernae]
MSLASEIAHAIQRHAKSDAVVSKDGTINYFQLKYLSICFQEFAQQQGLSSNDVIAYCGSNSRDRLAFFLGGLLGAYIPALLPISSGSPFLDTFLFSIDAKMLISEVTEASSIPQWTPTDAKRSSSGTMIVQDRSVSHISFTSGTLGHPRIIHVSADAVLEFCDWFCHYIPLSSNDRWAEPGNITSDLAITNTILRFFCGAAFIDVSTEDFPRLSSHFAENRVSIVRSTPRAAEILLASNRRRQLKTTALRLIGFGGDQLTSNTVFRMMNELSGDITFINTYGKAEIAGILSIYCWERGAKFAQYDGCVSVGQFVPGVEAESGVSFCDSSELVVQSRRNAILIKNLLSGEIIQTERKTKSAMATGDLVRKYDEFLYVVGRVDREVTRHGYQVNLDKLGTIVSELLKERSAAVLIKERLILLVEAPPDVDVKTILSSMMPYYLVPDKVIFEKQLPVNRSGKIDINQCKIIAESAI